MSGTSIIAQFSMPLKIENTGNVIRILGSVVAHGRVLETRSRGCVFEPHQHHCVVSLSKKLIPLLSQNLGSIKI